MVFVVTPFLLFSGKDWGEGRNYYEFGLSNQPAEQFKNPFILTSNREWV